MIKRTSTFLQRHVAADFFESYIFFHVYRIQNQAFSYLCSRANKPYFIFCIDKSHVIACISLGMSFHLFHCNFGFAQILAYANHVASKQQQHKNSFDAVFWLQGEGGETNKSNCFFGGDHRGMFFFFMKKQFLSAKTIVIMMILRISSKTFFYAFWHNLWVNMTKICRQLTSRAYFQDEAKNQSFSMNNPSCVKHLCAKNIASECLGGCFSVTVFSVCPSVRLYKTQ